MTALPAAAPPVPTRVIYSRRDGIVGTAIARLADAENIEYVQVDSSHMGFAINVKALGAVAQGLAVRPDPATPE